MIRTADECRRRVTRTADEGKQGLIRTLIAESNALIRAGLSSLLGKEPDIEVVAQLDRSATVVPAACAFQPKVAVADAGMAAHDGFAMVRALHAAVPSCSLLIMASTSDNPCELREAVTAYADGVVLKDSDPDKIIEAIRRVAAGGKAVDPDLAPFILNDAANPLTPREVDILRLVAQGAPDKEIASKLYLSVGTVRNYLSRTIGKIGARNRIDALRIASSAGWVLPARKAMAGQLDGSRILAAVLPADYALPDVLGVCACMICHPAHVRDGNALPLP